MHLLNHSFAAAIFLSSSYYVIRAYKSPPYNIYNAVYLNQLSSRMVVPFQNIWLHNQYIYIVEHLFIATCSETVAISISFQKCVVYRDAFESLSIL